MAREQFRRFASAAHQPRAREMGSRLMCCTRETTKLFPLHSHTSDPGRTNP